MVTDAISGEPLIGATIIYGKGKGVVSDLDGNYSFLINQGERNLTISYVGYKPLSKTISVAPIKGSPEIASLTIPRIVV